MTDLAKDVDFVARARRESHAARVQEELEIEVSTLRAALQTTRREALEKLEIAAALIRKQQATISALAAAGVVSTERLEELQPLVTLAWRFARGDARTSEVMDQLAKLGGLEIKRRANQS